MTSGFPVLLLTLGVTISYTAVITFAILVLTKRKRKKIKNHD